MWQKHPADATSHKAASTSAKWNNCNVLSMVVKVVQQRSDAWSSKIQLFSRWWFQTFCLCSPLFGEDEPNLTNMFQMGWNQQPVFILKFGSVIQIANIGNHNYTLGILAHLVRMVMETKCSAFRRWLDIPIILWQGDWIPRDSNYM